MDDGDSPIGDTESIYPDTSSMTDIANLVRPMHELKLRNSHSEYVVSQPTDIQNANSSTDGVTIVKSQSDRFVFAKSTAIVSIILTILILTTTA